MAEINDLNVTDASNTARFPENQAPSTVNNGARALEGMVARWHKDTNGSLVSTGSANAYVLAANQTLSAYYDGLSLVFETNFANTGAATLNVDAVGAQAIVWPDGTAMASGDIPSGAKVKVSYDLDNTRWMLLSPTAPMVSDVVLVQDQPASGVGGPAYTAGAWRTVTLDTEEIDTGGIASLAANQVTLAAGSYNFEGVVTLGNPAGTGNARARLRNTTDASTAAQGNNTGFTTALSAHVPVNGQFTIAASKVFELQVYPVTNNISAGGAIATGEVEIFASIRFNRYAR